jgi:hypothetical protein
MYDLLASVKIGFVPRRVVVVIVVGFLLVRATTDDRQRAEEKNSVDKLLHTFHSPNAGHAGTMAKCKVKTRGMRA